MRGHLGLLTFAQVCLRPVTVLDAPYTFEQGSTHHIYKIQRGDSIETNDGAF